MWRRRIRMTLPLLLATCGAAATRPVEPVPPHLADARAMVADIRPAANTYAYGPGDLRWKGEAGSPAYACHASCSAFLTLLLMHAYHTSAEQMQAMTGSAHPHAAVWHDAIVARRRGLRQITHLADARPGDILAVRFPPGTAADTGHVMLVDVAAVPHAASAPVVPGTTQWDVTIIDSSKDPHGPADTRRPADGPAGTGVGRGTVRIYTHPDGTVAGYAWSDSAKTAYRPQAEREMVIGRLEVAGEGVRG